MLTRGVSPLSPALVAGALEDPRLLAQLSRLGPGSDRAWLLAFVLGTGLTTGAAIVAPDIPFGGRFWVYASIPARIAVFLWAGRALRGRGGEVISRLLALGLCAGIAELPVDWFLVHGLTAGRLVYFPSPDVVLLASPLWMPLAWTCVIVELGYPALRLYGAARAAWSPRRAAWAACAGLACAAAAVVGLYEWVAPFAGWWRYEPAAWMLGPGCAAYILVGEGLMFLAFLPIAARVVADDERPAAAAALGGLRFGACIAAGYGAAYLLLEVLLR